MRLAKITQLLLLLSLQAFLGTCLAAQEHPNVVPSRVRDQLNQAPASAPAAPAPAAAPAQQTVKKPAAPGKPATSATNPTPSEQTAKKAAAPGTKISPAPAAK